MSFISSYVFFKRPGNDLCGGVDDEYQYDEYGGGGKSYAEVIGINRLFC
jgi:hypothetical protein